MVQLSSVLWEEAGTKRPKHCEIWSCVIALCLMETSALETNTSAYILTRETKNSKLLTCSTVRVLLFCCQKLFFWREKRRWCHLEALTLHSKSKTTIPLLWSSWQALCKEKSFNSTKGTLKKWESEGIVHVKLEYRRLDWAGFKAAFSGLGATGPSKTGETASYLPMALDSTAMSLSSWIMRLSSKLGKASSELSLLDKWINLTWINY